MARHRRRVGGDVGADGDDGEGIGLGRGEVGTEDVTDLAHRIVGPQGPVVGLAPFDPEEGHCGPQEQGHHDEDQRPWPGGGPTAESPPSVDTVPGRSDSSCRQGIDAVSERRQGGREDHE